MLKIDGRQGKEDINSWHAQRVKNGGETLKLDGETSGGKNYLMLMNFKYQLLVSLLDT